jgi:hypothetical protein
MLYAFRDGIRKVLSTSLAFFVGAHKFLLTVVVIILCGVLRPQVVVRVPVCITRIIISS